MSENLTVHVVKELLKRSAYEIVCSMGDILKAILPFKNCEISGWQKRQLAHTFFVNVFVFKPASQKDI